jgi:uncharacterized membrane protein
MKRNADAPALRIAKLVRVVVLSSAAVILIGLVLYLATGTGGYDGSTYPINPAHIISGVLALKPYAVIMLGIFLLVLTPVLRVAVSVIVFMKEKDALYVIITVLVLVILIVSLVIGITGNTNLQ